MKIALVTGGSRGIGKAVSLKLASDGLHVIINYRSNDVEATKTLEIIKENGGSGELLKFDVADRNEVRTVIDGWKAANPEKFI
ncbi:MAG TPA: SDR family NAD(P)-dependent oxidoreductase, partial [bacterium]|nr:SDR family NAD(P)-dependent oxidoreductase [bacterium]